MFNVSNLFINELIFAANINALSFVKHIAQFCSDECSSLFVLPIGFLGFIINTILFSSIAYSLLFILRGILSKKLSQYSNYPQSLNILIRLIPFGYIFTSIITIVQGNSYWKGLGKEILYSIGVTIIYILVAYFLYLDHINYY